MKSTGLQPLGYAFPVNQPQFSGSGTYDPSQDPTLMARVRSQSAHDRVLRAALDLFAERGIEATSMDAIVQASGVSKATIYNHWANKEALLMEVMLFVNGLDRVPEDPDTGQLERDIAIVLGRRP